MTVAVKAIAAVFFCLVTSACNSNMNANSNADIHGANAASIIKNNKISREKIINNNRNLKQDLADSPWFAESPEGRAIISSVQRGEPAALASYDRLRNSRNSEWTEDLDMAVAEALPLNPKGVLAMADTPQRFGKFCSVPFIEPTLKVEQAFLRASFSALRTIANDSLLAARRDACVVRLQAVEHAIPGQAKE